ncbi:MAG: zinc metalloprotease [Saprospiraceae bacterium]|nr:zinc metalloprotease [Saprospiraceae bacterium]
MKKSLSCFTIVLGLSFANAFAQHTGRCMVQKQNASANTYQPKGIITDRAMVVIPVVVHVVWNSSEENISDEQIRTQIEVLNLDFNAENEQIGNVPLIFQGAIADVDFEFCLASKDPEGNTTNGITRTQTSNSLGMGGTTALHYTEQGGHDAWNPDKYLNIWVTKFSGNIGGTASFPGEGPTDEQGVEVNYKQFGTTGTATAPPYHLGRTCTHEIGHYFNLEHLWGPNINSCCNEDDGVSDTPNSCETYINQCPTGNAFSCTQPDMWMNFMNYTDDACMAMFSKGQKERMLAAMNSFRPGLLNSDGCETVPTHEIAEQNSLEVFGNPVGNELRFKVNASRTAQWELVLINAIGQVEQLGQFPANQLFTLSFQAKTSGIYTLVASQNGRLLSTRIVK